MKVAVLLTGQLRTVDMVKYLHMNSLISKYDADVFLGIDIVNKHQCEYENPTDNTDMQYVNTAIQFFKPVDTFILDDFTDEIQRLNIMHQHVLLYRQYYVVKNTYKLLMNHMIHTNKNYDIIIRLRFDQFIFSSEVPICSELESSVSNQILYNEKNTSILDSYTKDKKFVFNEIHDNTIYVFGFGNFQHYMYANDQFFYHTTSILNKIFEFYDNISDTMKYCFENNIGNNGALIECIFYTYITKFNNINLKQSNIGGIFIRENCK